MLRDAMLAADALGRQYLAAHGGDGGVANGDGRTGGKRQRGAK